MSNQKDQHRQKSQTQTRTSGPPIVSVTKTKGPDDSGLWDEPVTSFAPDRMSGSKNKNVKMCKVCLATFNHERKCTNTQLQLEGANSLYAK